MYPSAKAGQCGEPFSSHCSEAVETPPELYIMKGTPTKTPREPVGIVISGMPRVEYPTVFTAYVWAPAPSATDDEAKAD